MLLILINNFLKMRKVFLVLFVAALGIVSANAQKYYVGGSVGFFSNSNKPEGAPSSSESGVSIIPEFGINLNEKLDLGISFGFSSLNQKETQAEKSSEFEVAPYLRYSFAQFGKFSVWGQAAVSFAAGTTENTNSGVKNKYSTFGLNIAPVLKYSLSDKFDLLANLNFFNVGFNSTSYKQDSNKLGTTSSFGIGADTYDVARLGAITVGFVYKF